LGNVRAAVFNWLFARHHRGRFVLRIEDTDVERNVEGSLENILEDLRWLGLDWDEGPDRGGPHAPYRQSDRASIHGAAVERLLTTGAAYPCFCSAADREAATEPGKGGREVHRYSGTCRRLTPTEGASRRAAGEPAVIRFAVPEGLESLDITDEVFGHISFPIGDIDDFVIRRSDGRVTYNFAVVVDDIDMEITHVIRGVGHLSNTPKQALVFDALGAARPRFAHLPTVLGRDGRKLSKREGAVSVAELRDRGYPPSAVLNYVSLLGWSHPEEREVLTADELVAAVGLERVGRSDAHVDPDKLAWLSAQHIAAETLEELTRHVRPFLDLGNAPVPSDRLPAVVDALRSRLSTYADLEGHLGLLFPEGDPDVAAARAELEADESARRLLRAVASDLQSVEPWEPDGLGAAVRAAGAREGAKGAGLFHPLRTALIGSGEGPDLGKILAALGREEALGRLRAVAEAKPV
jgi:nondiscriminating glutamyl-tRNA synthetase